MSKERSHDGEAYETLGSASVRPRRNGGLGGGTSAERVNAILALKKGNGGIVTPEGTSTQRANAFLALRKGDTNGIVLPSGGEQQQDEPPRRRLRLVRASAVKARRAAWLWQPDVGRIPAGEVSISAGRGNVGKSPFVLWLAAQLSRGELPGEYHGKPVDVILYASEDSHAHTTRPRLEAAGADLDRIHLLEGTETDEFPDLPLNWQRDIELLEEAIDEVGAKFLSIDPLLDIRKSGANSNSTDDWREALRPVIALAHKTGCAVHGIAHMNKSRGGPVADMISGAHGLRDAVRAVLIFAEGEDGVRVLGQDKNNLGLSGDDVPRLTYDMASIDVRVEGQLMSHPAFRITGSTDATLSELLNRDTNGNGPAAATSVPERLQWMFDLLDRAHPYGVATRTLAGQAEENGLVWATITKAAKKSGLMCSYDDRNPGSREPRWVWSLTDAGAELAARAHAQEAT